MNKNPADNPETLTASAVLTLAGRPVKISVTAPVGPASLISMLPLIQWLADTIVDVAIAACQDQGRTVSCRKGCGACCAHLVPLAELEARHIRNLVDEIPEPRRSAIRARFAEGQRRLQEAGLLEKLLDPGRLQNDDLGRLGLEYFQLGIPCPFLEEQSCLIHPQRPILCREYLVTSPAEHCANPTAQKVARVALPGDVFGAILHLGDDQPARVARWVPLILAPQWADSHRDESVPRPGTELLQELFEKLSGKRLPTPPFLI